MLAAGWTPKHDANRPCISRPRPFYNAARCMYLCRCTAYSPQPYEQLARILRTQGRPGEADTILYAGRERERLDSSGSLYLWLSTLKIIIGYGYQVWLAIIWLNLLWILGAFVQWTRPAARNKSVVQLLMYSFEMLLPIFRLRGDTKDFRSAPQDIWFHFQSLLGIVLTAFLAAGLAGLTK